MNLRMALVAQGDQILLGIDSTVLQLDDVMPGSCRAPAHKADPEPTPGMELTLGVIEVSPALLDGSLRLVWNDDVGQIDQSRHLVVPAESNAVSFPYPFWPGPSELGPEPPECDLEY